MRNLCRLDDIPDGSARGFGPAPGGFTGLFAVRRGDAVHVYINACPHVGVSLDWAPDQFLTDDGAQIICATHGALFDIETGRCTAGPCVDEHLEKIDVTIADGEVLAPDAAGL